MSIQKIACCTDFSEHAHSAVDEALEMAEKYGAKLYILHVVPPVITPVLADSEPELGDGEPHQSLILRIEDRMGQELGPRISDQVDSQFVVLSGHVSTEILDFLEKNDIDVAVMGSYGLTGMGLVVFGSVAKRVAHKAPCSVMIVRKKEKEPA